MRKTILLTICRLGCLFTLPEFLTAGTNGNQAEPIAAREARDRASVDELQTIIAQEKEAAKGNDNFDNNLRLALLQSWLCEAAEPHKNDKLIGQAAKEGLAAAERAVALDQQSSEAHQLVGESLNLLIPHVFGGGMRYGKHAVDEMDKAIQLDPTNPRACVSRAISYYYTPEAFGGAKNKAFDLLHKAVELDPKADTPHVWLAIFFLQAHQVKEASREIIIAREINSNRAFTNSVFDQINTAAKQSDSSR
jgi:Flp pilus assembly protein TadD